MKKKKLFVVLFLFCFLNLFAQEKTILQSYSFQEAEKLQKINPEKVIFVFLHTEWCKFCKKMEETTFSDSEIVKKINQKLIFVPFNPEKYKEDIVFRGRKFRYKKQSSNRGVHEIAEHLVGLGKRIDYPTLIFLNSQNEVIFSISSYLNKKQLEKLLDSL